MKEVLNAPCDDLESVLRDLIVKKVLLYGNLPSVFSELRSALLMIFVRR